MIGPARVTGENRVLIGCIADDFTGATDLASALVKGGLRTVQVIGVPATLDSVPLAGVDAVVVALKSRTVPVATAVEKSVEALDWLGGLGCRQYYFKYCSTFDSTPEGNIGPVIDALMDRLGVDFTIACPSLPANGRTVYMGYLFLGAQLLSESPMRHHPLTPMLDSHVGRLLQAQTSSRVGLVPKDVVDQGPQQVRSAFDRLRGDGCHIAVIDAIDTDDLVTIGRACADLRLVTGGAGLATGLARSLREAGELRVVDEAGALPAGQGACAVVAGSASSTTREQIKVMLIRHPGYVVETARVADGRQDVVAAALQWAAARLPNGPVLIYTETADPHRSTSGVAPDIAERLEETLAAISRGLVEMGVGRLVVAGGETSGAVVSALGATALRIGEEISPGVPWTTATGTARPVALALKSGGFGTPDFFQRALDTAP